MFYRREMERRTIDTRFPSAPESGSQTIHRSNGLNVRTGPRRKSHQEDTKPKNGIAHISDSVDRILLAYF